MHKRIKLYEFDGFFLYLNYFRQLTNLFCIFYVFYYICVVEALVFSFLFRFLVVSAIAVSPLQKSSNTRACQIYIQTRVFFLPVYSRGESAGAD